MTMYEVKKVLVFIVVIVFFIFLHWLSGIPFQRSVGVASYYFMAAYLAGICALASRLFSDE